MNRLELAIVKAREQYATLTPEKQAAFDKTLDLDFDEHFQYQETQARAHASGNLTAAEAQICYIALGEVGSDSNGGWAKGTDAPTKYVVTLMIGALLERRLGLS